MFNSLKPIISNQRLLSFRIKDCDELETLTRCLWNTKLSESFYPPLQHFEIGLRNTMHEAISFFTRNQQWYKERFICEDGKDDVANAEERLIVDGKDKNDSGRVIAELSFGFWTRLFNTHYQKPLWNNKTFTMRAFPYATNQQRSRDAMSTRVRKIRRFRNRVFHHESILSNRHKMQEIHTEIIEMMGWISPELVQLNNIVGRFNVTLSQDRYDKLKESLSKHFPQ